MARKALPGASTQPLARFFGVPFLRGLAREVTAIHLCPARVHLATVKEGAQVELFNRLTLRPVDLGDLEQGRLLAFRPALGGEAPLEMAIAGPLDRPELARFDVTAGRPLPGLPLEAVTALQYSWDGRFLAAGNLTGCVKVWHLGPGGPAQVLQARFDAQVESLAFHPEHPTVYATLASGALVELELAGSQAAPAAAALRAKAPGVLFHRVAAGPRGYPIYLAGRDDRVYVVDTATGDVGVLTPQIGPITGLQVLPASGHLCVQGPRSLYLLHHPADPGGPERLAQVCAFEDPVYAAWELERDAILVFYAAD